MTAQKLPINGSGPGELEFPLAIDSTMRGAFSACPQKFFWEFMRHLQPSLVSVHLHAGAAYAKGLEVARKAYYGDGVSAQTAKGLGGKALIEEYGEYEPPSNSPKTLEGMLGAYSFYLEQFPFETDTLTPFRGSDGVEFSFALPIPGTAHPATGEPILYMGRFDMLGQIGGDLWVVDDKTTQALGPSWSKQWDLRGQFTGYCWAAREYGYDVKGALIRGVSILKTKFGHAQALTYRPQWLIDSWLEQLARDVNRMIALWEEGHWDRNYDGACVSYGTCQFHTLCSVPEPERWVKADFVERQWNPLVGERKPKENAA